MSKRLPDVIADRESIERVLGRRVMISAVKRHRMKYAGRPEVVASIEFRDVVGIGEGTLIPGFAEPNIILRSEDGLIINIPRHEYRNRVTREQIKVPKAYSSDNQLHNVDIGRKDLKKIYEEVTKLAASA